MNSCTFIGNAGGDAELRYTESGTAIATFSLAVNRKRGEEQETLWLACALFGERAEKLAEYITKGKQLYVRGELRERTWSDDQGIEHRRIELNVGDLQLLGGPAGDGGSAAYDREREPRPAPRQGSNQRPQQGHHRQGGNRPPQNRGGRR